MRLTILISLGLFAFSASPADAQELVTGPYLQSASPTSIWISWETMGGESTTVEWGTVEPLVDTAGGGTIAGPEGHVHHEVQLENLTPDTRYLYRVVTDEMVSDIFHFRTPPVAADEAPFRLLAMSDMQIDRGRPNQFREVIEDGVIPYVTATYGPELTEELGLILIPGDLVEDGNEYHQWAAEFFAPAEALFPYVPVYPVTGNHENNSQSYFDYFHLPDNGTPGFEEHWYFVDHGNLRVVGLDSNGLYRNPVQIEWLERVLADTCANDEIDFVFAQLHHPHHSELWPAGNTHFTGDVIAVLEAFSSDCEKPSLHFFGHTHGYSRGQSRDHRHLMVNVASAGGNLDYWDEYPQADYPEYSVSHDEYGFVIVDVEAGADPSFQLTRISLGNQTQGRDNEVRDTVTVRRYNTAPTTPTKRGPLGRAVSPRCFTLGLSPFDDADGDAHWATHWQVARDCDGFDSPIVDRWRQRENWYGDENTQANDDLTDEEIEGLDSATEYCWRGRYRDEGLRWSAWSTPESFRTGEGDIMEYDLENPGAEDGKVGWVVEEGIFESLSALECEGVSPYEGERYFVVGGLCESSDSATVRQEIDLSPWMERVEAGELIIWGSAHARDWNGSDLPELSVSFADVDGVRLPGETRTSGNFPEWTLIETVNTAPPTATKAYIGLHGTRNTGNDNDSYFDSVRVRILFGAALCDDAPSADDPPPPPPDAGVSPAPIDAASGMDPADATALPVDAGVSDIGPEENDALLMPDEEPEGCASVPSNTRPDLAWALVLVLALGRMRRRH